MVEFDEKLRKSKDYLLKVIDNAKEFKIENKSFYYYSYQSKNFILFFGRKLPNSHLQKLREKYNKYELILFFKKPSVDTNEI